MPCKQISTYSKAYKLEEQSPKDHTNTRTPKNNELGLIAREYQPGPGYAYMKENKHYKIPLMSIPEGYMCQIKDLPIGFNEVSIEEEDNRERYAKTALIMFSPFCCLEELVTNCSY